MECDAYADIRGQLKIEIRNYENGKILHTVKLKRLEPRNKLSVEYIKGERR